MSEEKELLNDICEDTVFVKLLHFCINNFQVDSDPVRLYTENGIQLSDEESVKVHDMSRIIKQFYRQIALNQNEPPLEYFPKKNQEMIKAMYQLRQKDITNMLRKEFLLLSGHKLVENFDWQLKWIMGSSTLSTLREPICEIDLCCLNRNNEYSPTYTSHVKFEANIEKIDEFINVLKSMKTKLSEIE